MGVWEAGVQRLNFETTTATRDRERKAGRQNRTQMQDGGPEPMGRRVDRRRTTATLGGRAESGSEPVGKGGGEKMRSIDGWMGAYCMMDTYLIPWAQTQVG